MTYHQQKVRGYGHLTVSKILPFVVMQRVARVCQRQLSYLLHLALPFISSLQAIVGISNLLWVERSKF